LRTVASALHRPAAGSGNDRQPDLADVDPQLDLRWEYYSPTANRLGGAVPQGFSDPIEKIQVPGTGNLLSLANADSASNRGIELDYFRGLEFVGERWTNFYTAANYAWIDSEIDLGGINDIQTNDQRPMQGQSPFVANLQLGYRKPDNSLEATLLYNVFGRRISQVGVFGAPDIYEQDFHSSTEPAQVARPGMDPQAAPAQPARSHGGVHPGRRDHPRIPARARARPDAGMASTVISLQPECNSAAIAAA
jgi:hypothetical protein